MGWMETVKLCIPLSGLLLAVGIVNIAAVSPPEIESGPRDLRSQPPPPKPQPATPPPVQPAPFPSFNSSQLDQQLQRYLRFVAELGAPDILIVGSSRALQGVDPIALQRSLAQQGHPSLTVFNFGINGATAQVVDLILRQLLTRDQLPRLIVWADGARAFNSGRLDLTYNKIAASRGYQLLTSGVRPSSPVLPFASLRQSCMEFPSLLEQVQSFKQPTSTLSKLLPIQPSPSRLCGDPLKQLVQSMPVPPTSQAIADLQKALGFQAVPTRFNPVTYFKKYPRVPGRFDADYRNFTLQGNQTVALNQVLSFARSRQIPIVFVNLPMTQIYLDPARSGYEGEFRSFMQRFGQSGQLTFHDFNTVRLKRNGYFADPSHLNRFGASAVSFYLGKELGAILPSSRKNGKF